MTEAQQQLALDRARQGDSRALASLLDSFRPYFRVLDRGTHPDGHSSDDAELVQEALREAQRTFDRFQGSTVAELTAWLRALILRAASPTLNIHPAASTQLADAHDSWATWDGSKQSPQVFIGRYVVQQALGAGGMGVVCRAHDPQLQRTVAIKVPRFDGARPATELARLRFLREARAAAAIRHPHVCPIHDVGEHDGVPYVVMAFVEGQSLSQRLAEGRFEDCALAVRLAREIAEALAAVHAHGIVHRDLKPGNILLDRAGHAVLTDFGLSRFEHDAEQITEEGSLTGTPAYMAPEQARRGKVDARSDLFSLGTVLYEVFTGELPFKGGDTMALLSALALDTPIPPAKLNHDLPRALADLLVQLLAKDPAKRPGSAQEVVDRLQDIEHELTGDQTPAPTGRLALVLPDKNNADTLRSGAKFKALRQARGRRKRLQARVCIGLLVGVVATIAAIWLGGSPARSTTDADQEASQSPDGKPGVLAGSGKLPLKVVILAGQSNMSGRAAISTLDTIGDDPRHRWLLSKIKNKDGSWKVREDVWVSYQRQRELKLGRLTVGFGESDREIGPELLFGHVLGDAVENPILLVKITQGPMSLGVESRPPSSGGVVGPFYKRMIETVRDVLANPKAHYPHYEGQGCEIAGFVWFQGWNDHLRPELMVQYERNLVNLINDLRRDLAVPNLPVVVGEEGIGGKKPNAQVLVMRKAQAGAVRRPEFAGSVALVETSGYWDEQAGTVFLIGYDGLRNKWRDEQAKKQFEKLGCCNPEFLYLGSGKIFAQIGNGFAEAMKELWTRKPPNAR